jgi:D-serine dehydratase
LPKPDKPSVAKLIVDKQIADKLIVAQQSSSVSRLNKGLGDLERDINPEEIALLDWNLLREDLSLPVAVLSEEKMLRNLQWMQKFIGAYGVKLAPHGKTTMAPKLFELQVRGGAWGITLATAHQCFVAWQHGLRRVLMANELVGKQNMALVSRMIADPEFEYYCLVDSADAIEALGKFFSPRRQCLRVLLEVGAPGGRCGVRSDEQLKAVLDALEQWKGSILLSGVELYEGILDNETEVRAFLQRAVDITEDLILTNRFEHKPPLLSGAGSTWFDVVADIFTAAVFSEPVEIVLRPGCYLTHDAGFYREAHAKVLERNSVARQIYEGLEPALQVWAYIQSVPEETRAIVGIGKRDASFDLGLPFPALHFRPGRESPAPAPKHWAISKMMDQHAHLEIAAGDDIRVGDMIGFDISHPCLTFDRWRIIPVVNNKYRVVDLVETYF